MKKGLAFMEIWEFVQKQRLPYEQKIILAERRAREFYDELDGMCYVSVGGLDSITLLLFLRKIGLDVPAVSVSCLEDRSIQRVHKQLGVEVLKPLKTQKQVVEEYGYPIISPTTAEQPKADLYSCLNYGRHGKTGRF